MFKLTAVKRWKFLCVEGNGTIVSAYGRRSSYTPTTYWKVGDWKHLDGHVQACYRGFHSSAAISDAFSYVHGSVAARVEVKGCSDVETDKEAHSDMRLVKARLWTPADNRALALFLAEKVAPIFTKHYPTDTTVERTIKATRAVHLGARPADAVFRQLLGECESAGYSWGSRSAGRVAAKAAYYAGLGMLSNTSLGDTGDMAGCTLAEAKSAVFNEGLPDIKPAIDEWMENRFKTLPAVG